MAASREVVGGKRRRPGFSPFQRVTPSEGIELPEMAINDAQLMLLFSDKAEKYADARVTCKGIEWKVQQSILCTRCSFFEEGESKTVDFDDDQPHAVEALLIYLYTFEYPNRKSDKFEEPASDADCSTSPYPGQVTEAPRLPNQPDKQSTPSSPRYKLKSKAPTSSWDEHLALYQIAHRLGVRPLCKPALEILTKNISDILRSSSGDQFVKEVYGLDQEETQSLRQRVVTKVAELESSSVVQKTLDSVVGSHPLFGRDLIDAMRKKQKDRQQNITEQRKKLEDRERELAEYKKVTLREQKKEVEKQKAAATEAKRTATDAKKKATELRKELAESKKKNAQLRKEFAARGKEIYQSKEEPIEQRKEAPSAGGHSGANDQPNS